MADSENTKTDFAVIAELFSHCQDASGDEFPNALIPVDPFYEPGKIALTEFCYREIEELFQFSDKFGKLLQALNKQDAWPYEDCIEMQVRLMLLVYCHIMEADFPYVVFLNLCRVTNNLEPRWGFFARNEDDSLKMNKNNHPIPLKTIDDKVFRIGEFSLAKELDFINVLSKLWCNDLRNAFSHSQYVISPTGYLLCSKWLTGVTGKSAESVRCIRNGKVDFKFNDIKSYYDNSCNYFVQFRKTYMDFVKPYMNAERVKLHSGYVRWNIAKDMWEPCS